MTDLRNRHIVSVDWLQANLQAPGLMLFDASWHLPMEARNARAEYEKSHIPGAFFFDLDDHCDDSSPLPHMLPPPARFAVRMKRIGVSDTTAIVVYDTKGLFSAARAWWTFRALGHANVAVLDGGLPAWRNAALPLTDQPPAIRPARHFTPRPIPAMVARQSDVEFASTNQTAAIADARPSARFKGTAPEPRPGLRSGHIPGSYSIPHSDVLNTDGTLKSPTELRAVFAAAGIDFSKPIITSCGSGVTAAVLSLALAVAGHDNHSLYDGSWAEWGQPDTGGTVVTE